MKAMTMKRIILAFAFLILAFPATAQVNQLTILAPLTPAFVVPFSATASNPITSKFTAATRAVRVICSVSCAVQSAVSGVTPVAFNGSSNGLTSSMVLAPNVPEYLSVEPNGRIAVIGINASGTLYVQEVGR